MFHFTKAGLTKGHLLVFGPITWMNRYTKHKDKYPIDVRYKRLRYVCKEISKGFNVDYYYEGIENIPEETCCFVSNHMGSFDPVALISTIERPTSFVAKKELINTPILGSACKVIDVEFLDRNDLKQSLKTMQVVQNQLKNKEKNWIIFPEGTRNKDELSLVKEFHHGTFRPAVKAGVPIVPVAIYGSQRVFKMKPQYKRYPVCIKFLKPIYLDEYKTMNTQELAVYCQNEIQKAISFSLRKLDKEKLK